jgi:hypothetical protein
MSFVLVSWAGGKVDLLLFVRSHGGAPLAKEVCNILQSVQYVTVQSNLLAVVYTSPSIVSAGQSAGYTPFLLV